MLQLLVSNRGKGKTRALAKMIVNDPSRVIYVLSHIEQHSKHIKEIVAAKLRSRGLQLDTSVSSKIKITTNGQTWDREIEFMSFNSFYRQPEMRKHDSVVYIDNLELCLTNVKAITLSQENINETKIGNSVNFNYNGTRIVLSEGDSDNSHKPDAEYRWNAELNRAEPNDGRANKGRTDVIVTGHDDPNDSKPTRKKLFFG